MLKLLNSKRAFSTIVPEACRGCDVVWNEVCSAEVTTRDSQFVLVLELDEQRASILHKEARYLDPSKRQQGRPADTQQKQLRYRRIDRYGMRELARCSPGEVKYYNRYTVVVVG